MKIMRLVFFSLLLILIFSFLNKIQVGKAASGDPPLKGIIQPQIEIMKGGGDDGIYDPFYNFNTIYCYKWPQDLRVSVPLDDIERGMAVYFRLWEKVSRRETAWDKVDLHRDGPYLRSGTITGSHHGMIKYPHGWGESWIKMQVITDNADYRSHFYFDVTYFPCHH